MIILVYIFGYLSLLLGSFYALWVLYLAVMNLKRVKDLGLLHKRALLLGTPILVLGLLVDLLCNILLSIPMLELPRELTVTARLKRHNLNSNNWRKSIALWFEPILDPFDPSGDHV